MDEPLISVVVPVYNGKRFLAQALQSIRDQTYRNVDVVVVDDGSTDGSADLIDSFASVRHFSQSNQGNAAARNRGIAEAAGEHIAFLDQDDLWTPNKLAAQMQFLRKNPAYLAVVGHQRYIAEPGGERPAWIRPELWEQDHTGYVPGSLLARRELFDVVGRFDARYRYGSDSDWFFRAQDTGVKIGVIPQTVLLRRIHEGNLSHDVRGSKSDMLRLVRASIGRHRQSGAGGTHG